MYKNKKILAIIPARSGSKRLPNKNILNLEGKPLIAWTIEEAKKSKYIDKIVVSTDSEQIAEISRQYGAEIPFLRPAELAQDTTSSIDVIKYCLENIKENFDYLMLLQPTSPLRTSEDIDNAINMLDENTLAVVSVCETEHSPLWSNTLPEDLSMENFLRPEVKNKRSQDLPKFYRLNGAVFLAEINYFYRHNGFYGPKTKALIMRLGHSIDIDTELDFLICKTILSNK